VAGELALPDACGQGWLVAGKRSAQRHRRDNIAGPGLQEGIRVYIRRERCYQAACFIII
jgi:hypothetical protein